MRQRWLLLFVGAEAFASGSGAAEPVDKFSLCKPPERAIFECAVPRGKRLALCAQPPDRVQYRFGTSSRLELAFPDDPLEGPDKLLFAHYFRAQVDRITVRFKHNGIEYQVFDFEEGGKRRAGVGMTSASGSAEHVLRCQGRIVSRPDEAKALLRCDAENALSDCR